MAAPFLVSSSPEILSRGREKLALRGEWGMLRSHVLVPFLGEEKLETSGTALSAQPRELGVGRSEVEFHGLSVGEEGVADGAADPSLPVIGMASPDVLVHERSLGEASLAPAAADRRGKGGAFGRCRSGMGDLPMTFQPFAVGKAPAADSTGPASKGSAAVGARPVSCQPIGIGEDRSAVGAGKDAPSVIAKTVDAKGVGGGTADAAVLASDDGVVVANVMDERLLGRAGTLAEGTAQGQGRFVSLHGRGHETDVLFVGSRRREGEQGDEERGDEARDDGAEAARRRRHGGSPFLELPQHTMVAVARRRGARYHGAPSRRWPWNSN